MLFGLEIGGRALAQEAQEPKFKRLTSNSLWAAQIGLDSLKITQHQVCIGYVCLGRGLGGVNIIKICYTKFPKMNKREKGKYYQNLKNSMLCEIWQKRVLYYIAYM